ARADGLALAALTAAVERQRVLVVASFRALVDSIAAHRGGAGAGRAFALEADLDLAKVRASVPRHEAAVVALLGEHRDGVAALGDRAAGLTFLGADVAGFEEAAVLRAAIAGGQIAIV